MAAEVSENLSPNSRMSKRLHTVLQLELPKVDYHDLHENRQFAPEYSQKAFESAKADEQALGDYFGEQE